jgi:hypothetical protein
MLHEMIHFLDHVATPYGLFLDHLTALTTHLYRKLVALFNRPGAPPLAVPLAVHAQKTGEAWREFERRLRAAAAPGFAIGECVDQLVLVRILWAGVVRLERALEGEDLPTVDQVPAGYLANVLQLIERLAETAFVPPGDVLGLPYDPPVDWRAPMIPAPRVSWHGAGHRLGGIGLLESRAFFAQRGAFDPAAPPPDPLLDIRAAGDLKYFVSMGLLADAALALGATASEMFETYILLSELALFTPIGPVYSRFRTAPSWEEVHPGWRFTRLLGELPRIGPYRRGQGLDGLAYQGRFTSALGWPAKQEMLAAGAALRPATYRERRHRAACALKLRSPELFSVFAIDRAEPTAAEDEFFEEFLPFWVDPVAGRGVAPSSLGKDVAMERLGIAYMQSLGWWYLMAAGSDEPDHLDPRFPYERLLKWPGSGSLAEFFAAHVRQNLRVSREP